MKLIALSPKGYWYSRRNRIDLLITIAGVLWAILHLALPTDGTGVNFQFGREGVDTMGYIVIILRFFTITGKHVSIVMKQNYFLWY